MGAQRSGPATRTCESCGSASSEWYIADNNASGQLRVYCPTCEEHRAEKYGCAMILAEGASCQNGICGCGGTGTLLRPRR